MIGSGIARLRENENKHKVYGLVIGIVTKLCPANDPIGHRIKVKFPWLSEDDESDWARLITFGAGASRGFYCMPEVGDEVICGFEFGDVARPYVLGTVWNGKDKPTHKLESDKNEHRAFTSRSGHLLEFYDKSGKEKITLKSQKGAIVVIDDDQCTITMNDHNGDNTVKIDQKNKSISITANTGDIKLTAKEKIVLDCKELQVKSSANSKFEAGSNFEVKASSNLTLKASGSGELNASGQLTIKGSTVNIN